MPESSHVLIVDDHPHMVALIERWLVRAGYHVTGVTTVQEALEALTTHAPAWVITDLMLRPAMAWISSHMRAPMTPKRRSSS